MTPEVARFVRIHDHFTNLWIEYEDDLRELYTLDETERDLMTALDEMWAVFGVTREQRIRGF